MSEPYYDNGQGIQLYFGDCLEPDILEHWTRADVLITDPPYGTGLGLDGKNVKGGYGRRNLHGDPNGSDGFTIAGDNDTEARDKALARGRSGWTSRRHSFESILR